MKYIKKKKNKKNVNEMSSLESERQANILSMIYGVLLMVCGIAIIITIVMSTQEYNFVCFLLSFIVFGGMFLIAASHTEFRRIKKLKGELKCHVKIVKK